MEVFISRLNNFSIENGHKDISLKKSLDFTLLPVYTCIQMRMQASNPQTMKTEYQHYTLEDTRNREVAGGQSVGREKSSGVFIL
jgi:hypothetical protein